MECPVPWNDVPWNEDTEGLNSAIVTSKGQPLEHPSARQCSELSQPHQVQGAIYILEQLGKVLLEALATHLNTGFFLHINTGFQAKQAKQGRGE